MEEEEEAAAAEWAWEAEARTHQEAAGVASLRTKDGTRSPSPKTDRLTPPA